MFTRLTSYCVPGGVLNPGCQVTVTVRSGFATTVRSRTFGAGTATASERVIGGESGGTNVPRARICTVNVPLQSGVSPPKVNSRVTVCGVGSVVVGGWVVV